MWKYIKRYFIFAVIAAMFMCFEVLMDLLQPEIMQTIVDDGVLGLGSGNTGNMDIIIKYGLLMIGLTIFGGFCGSMNNVFVNLAGQNIGNEMRKDAFRHIMSFSFPQVDMFSSGSLITRVTNDITQVQGLISQFVRGMIRTTLLTVGSLYFMFTLNVQFGVIMLCVLPFIIGCMAFCLWKASPLFPQLQSQLDKLNEIMQEDISGIRIIKACVRETYEKLRFGKANGELIKTQLKTLVIFAFMNPVMNLLMNFAVLMVLITGNDAVAAGASTPGSIMAAITYSTTLLNGILMLVMLFQNITRGTASWKRVKQILDCTPEITDGSHSQEATEKGTVEFRHVSFGYAGNERSVLNDISFRIEKGETVAIMGATGCGKSTLVNLIPRFYDVTGGQVLMDGIDVKNYPLEELRDKITVVLQKAELFTQSIAENIRWGDPSASDEKIHKAALIAQADDFIAHTENGYDTLVAERGMSLSGGQKQRISIARAVLRDSEVLIFDDSTSALDLKTEAAFYDMLAAEKPDCTKIIVAQRIATVRRADKIIILENGRIEAIGSHAELMEKSHVYRDIYASQFGKEDEENE